MMTKQERTWTMERIAQLTAEMEAETRRAAKKELGVTIETLRKRMAR